jgi:Phytanoyl-CoA dioxygenase (PhyH)
VSHRFALPRGLAVDELFDRISVLAASTVGAIDADLVDVASERILRDGWAVIRGITDGDHVSAVGDAMLADARRLEEYSHSHRVRAPGHIGQVPPLRPGLVFCDLACNPTVIAIARSLFDASPYLAFYSGHTLMPGAQCQPVHLDLGHLWQRRAVAHPPYILAVNNAVVDVDDVNGSMEVWTGSHADLNPPYRGATLCLADAGLGDRHTALRVPMRAGDVLLRDMRLWHRGLENRTSLARPMMWSLLAAEWYSGGTRAALPEGTEPSLAPCGVHGQVEWVRDDADYLLRDL